MIKTLRISKTSAKGWALHGPIEAALKTTLQADAVRVIPLESVDHDGQNLGLELWINAEVEEGRAPNVPAMMILALSKARQKGIPHTTMFTQDETGDMTGLVMAEVDGEDMTPVTGPAVLTGAGGTDIPHVHPECLMQALLGDV